MYAFATHGLFNGPALERIAASEIHKLVVTDTVPLDPLARPANVQVLSIAGILAETISNVFADDSVSAIFARREPAVLAWRPAQPAVGLCCWKE